MIGENAPPPPEWVTDPHLWPTLSLPAKDFDRIMADLDSPPRVNERLRALVMRALAHQELSGLGEN